MNRMTPMIAANSSSAESICRIFSGVVEAVLNTRPVPPSVREEIGGAGRVWCTPDRPRWSLSDHLGPAFSMLSTVVLVSCPVIQLVACFQKASEPTAAGIWSEPSKRKVALGSSRIVAESLSIGFTKLLGSRPLLALTQPVDSLALMLAQVSVDRYSWNALTSGRSANATTNSPAPSTGLVVASLPGR